MSLDYSSIRDFCSKRTTKGKRLISSEQRTTAICSLDTRQGHDPARYGAWHASQTHVTAHNLTLLDDTDPASRDSFEPSPAALLPGGASAGVDKALNFMYTHPGAVRPEYFEQSRGSDNHQEQ